MAEKKISLSEIQSQIKKRKAEWKSAETSISKLSIKEQKKKLGLRPTSEELKMVSKMGLDKPLGQPSRKARKLTSETRLKALQESIDWRNDNGKDWTTIIKDQGSCGSCVAFGTIAALEALLKIHIYKDQNIDLSEAHLFYCGCGDCCGEGWYMDDACEYLKENGVPDEDCFPYEDSGVSCSDTCPDWKDRIDSTKLQDWSKTKDVNAMKKKIIENGPQITGMAVYDDFFYYSGGIYEHATGGLAGYHCVTIVGFNDIEGYWICKNSWGTGWGEEGWFRIAYGECGMQDVFGMWNMELIEEEVGTGTVIGTVLDKSSGTPIDIAKISAAGIPKIAETDSNGKYKLSEVPTGKRQIIARKDGYQDASTFVTVEENKEVTADFELVSGGCIIADCAKDCGKFDHQESNYPTRINDTCKVEDIKNIQAHAGYYPIGQGGNEFEFYIDKCPTLYIRIQAEKDTDTCLFLMVHDKKPSDHICRFVVVGKTPKGTPWFYDVAKDCFTIEDDGDWHEYTYDLRKLRDEYPDADTVRIVQFCSYRECGETLHAFYFSRLVMEAE